MSSRISGSGAILTGRCEQVYLGGKNEYYKEDVDEDEDRLQLPIVT